MKEILYCDHCTDRGHCPEYTQGGICPMHPHDVNRGEEEKK